MTEDTAWTVGRLLRWTTDFLADRGVESPRLDAEVLLAEARSCQRIDLYAAFDAAASAELRTAFRDLVRRRADGVPVAYLVGRREFYSLSFQVTPDVLIPRPETELLVVTVLDRLRAESAPAAATIADVGTGSGVIAVCLAKYGPNCHVTAIDISPAALALAARNAAAHAVSERIDFVESDLLAALPAGQRFDCIASNPPYVSRAEWEALPDEIKRHEPRQALDGGETGTCVIERLLQEAAERLRPGGWLLVEIGPTRVEQVEQLVRASRAFELGATVKDLAGLPRVVQARQTSG